MSTPERSSSSTVLEPEEPLLTKYSRHHELPISTLISVLTHALVALVAFLAGAWFFSWNSERTTPDVGILHVNPGGGNQGEDGGVPDGKPAREQVLVNNNPTPTEPSLPVPEVNLDFGNLPVNTPAKLREEEALQGKRLGAVQGKSTNKRGPGDGPGVGPGTDPGEAKARPPRAHRMDRWSLIIRFTSSEEYLAKLANLRARLAFPDGKGAFLVFSDLERKPPYGELQTTERLTAPQMIYWANQDPETVAGLARVLGVSFVPARMYVFFPQDLEIEMLKTELTHAKMTEQQIIDRGIKTQFRAERQGNRWVVTVVDQTRPKGK